MEDSVTYEVLVAEATPEEKPARRRQRTVTVPADLIVQEDRPEPPDTPTGLVRLAVQQGLDIDRLRELMALQREWEGHQARKAFFEALSKFQSELPPILKTTKADQGRGGVRYYATLGQINECIRPFLYANGLSFRFRIKQGADGITVTCIVSHRDGHSEETTMTAGADSSGLKNAIQSVSSTTSYLERYTLTAALGLTTLNEDDDGESAQQLTPEQQRQNALDLARAAAAGNRPAQEAPREPAGETRKADQQAAPPAASPSRGHTYEQGELGRAPFERHNPPAASQVSQDVAARVMIRPEQFREMMALMKELFATGAAAQGWLLDAYGTNNPQELMETEADGVLSNLLSLKHKMNQPATLPPAPAEPEGDHITDEQRAAIRDLTTQLWGEGAGECQAAWLGTLGYNSVRSCTRLQAAERISELDALLHPKADAADIPF